MVDEATRQTIVLILMGIMVVIGVLAYLHVALSDDPNDWL